MVGAALMVDGEPGSIWAEGSAVFAQEEEVPLSCAFIHYLAIEVVAVWRDCIDTLNRGDYWVVLV